MSTYRPYPPTREAFATSWLASLDALQDMLLNANAAGDLVHGADRQVRGQLYGDLYEAIRTMAAALATLVGIPALVVRQWHDMVGDSGESYTYAATYLYRDGTITQDQARLLGVDANMPPFGVHGYGLLPNGALAIEVVEGDDDGPLPIILWEDNGACRLVIAALGSAFYIYDVSMGHSTMGAVLHTFGSFATREDAWREADRLLRHDGDYHSPR